MVKKKDSDKLTVPVPDAETQPALPVDEWHGMGGSYILDPVTGTRVRTEGPEIVGADSIRPDEQPEFDETDEIGKEI